MRYTTLRSETQRQAPSTGRSALTWSTVSAAARSFTARSKVTMIGDPTPMVSDFSPIGVMSAMPSGAFLALTPAVARTPAAANGDGDAALVVAGRAAWPVEVEQAPAAARARTASDTLTVRLRGFTAYS